VSPFAPETAFGQLKLTPERLMSAVHRLASANNRRAQSRATISYPFQGFPSKKSYLASWLQGSSGLKSDGSVLAVAKWLVLRRAAAAQGNSIAQLVLEPVGADHLNATA